MYNNERFYDQMSEAQVPKKSKLPGCLLGGVSTIGFALLYVIVYALMWFVFMAPQMVVWAPFACCVVVPGIALAICFLRRRSKLGNFDISRFLIWGFVALIPTVVHVVCIVGMVETITRMHGMELESIVGDLCLLANFPLAFVCGGLWKATV